MKQKYELARQTIKLALMEWCSWFQQITIFEKSRITNGIGNIIVGLMFIPARPDEVLNEMTCYVSYLRSCLDEQLQACFILVKDQGSAK
jgi:hypothetical protein